MAGDEAAEKCNKGARRYIVVHVGLGSVTQGRAHHRAGELQWSLQCMGFGWLAGDE